MSLAAQAMDCGHQVFIINMSNYPWSVVKRIISKSPADLFGLSCLTANRRGVTLLSRYIRQTHPDAHIVIGGPHATAMPMEILSHCKEIDTVVVGEGEATFLDLLLRLETNRSAEGLAGAAWRTAGGIGLGPPRAPIKNLDELISPFVHFDLRTLLTSRGCPNHCTFCGSNMMWGWRLRFHSVAYVLEMIDTAVRGYGRKILAFKDDTFTADRTRALNICRQIRARKLDFIWSCETRADHLDEELVYAMRVAGCKRISLGVESAAPVILANIRKNVSPRQVINVTKLAKKYGIQVRYYMMAGNRGETYHTFRQSLNFIKKTRPHAYVFSQLHLYPGTEEFEIFRRYGAVTPEMFFDRDFMCLTCFAGSAADSKKILKHLGQLQKIRRSRDFSADAYRSVALRLPDLASIRYELASAFVRQSDLKLAEMHLEAAMAKNFCLPGLAFNLKACIAAMQGDLDTAGLYLDRAICHYPHRAVLRNRELIDRWRNTDSPSGPDIRELDTGDGFESQAICIQPEFPDPFFLDCDNHGREIAGYVCI